MNPIKRLLNKLYTKEDYEVAFNLRETFKKLKLISEPKFTKGYGLMRKKPGPKK